MTIEFERLGVAAALFDPERISPPATPESTRAKPQPPKPFRPMTDSDDNAHFAALDWDSADPARSLKDEFHQQAENAWLEDSFLPHHHSPSQMAQWDSHLFEEMPGADDREFDANDEKAGSG